MPTTPKLGVPYPAATDAPDGPGSLLGIATWIDGHVAPADRMCHAVWGSAQDPTTVNNGQADIVNDTVIYDPYSMRQSDSASFKLPWAGRYSLYTRVTFTNSDTQGYSLLWYNMTASSVLAWQGTPTIAAGTPVSIYTEEIVPAGLVVKPQVYKPGTTAQWQRHYVDSSTRTQSIIRYLGAA